MVIRYEQYLITLIKVINKQQRELLRKNLMVKRPQFLGYETFVREVLICFSLLEFQNIGSSSFFTRLTLIGFRVIQTEHGKFPMVSVSI